MTFVMLMVFLHQLMILHLIPQDSGNAFYYLIDIDIPNKTKNMLDVPAPGTRNRVPGATSYPRG